MNVNSAARSSARRKTPRDDIRSKRLTLQMSRTDLANEVGSHAQTIEKIESGEISWSRFLPAIERKLGIYKGKSPSEIAKNQELTTSSMSDYLTPTPALDIEGVSYSLARSPDGKRKAIMLTWTLKDGSLIRGALDIRMVADSARQFQRVCKAAGIDLSKLLGSDTESK